MYGMPEGCNADAALDKDTRVSQMKTVKFFLNLIY
jgi:hypothetical protein